MTTPTYFKRSTLSLALLTAFSHPVLAADETKQDTTQLETITVMGKAYRNTATKTALEPEETPQGITVIEGEQLEQRGVKSLNQALRYTPGVVTEQKGSSVTMYDTFSIRGFSNNQSYYDGLVLPFLTGWNLQPQIDPIMIQQIEVFKGPTSVLYGAMPPGGMINMIAKAPQKEDSTSVGLATGSRNLIEASIDTTGSLSEDVAYRFIALARTQDSQVDNAKEERYLIAPSVDWQVTDRTLINFNLYYQNDPSMGINSATPHAALGKVTPSASMGDVNWSEFEREVLMLGYKVNHEFNDTWSFLQNARYTDASLYQENTYHRCINYGGQTLCGFNEQTGTLVRNLYSTDESSQAFAIDNQLSGDFKFGKWQHSLLLGIDYQHLEGDSLYREFKTSNSAFYGFNAYNPNNNLLDRSTLSETSRAQTDVEADQLGFYFQDQIRYDRLILLAGGRFDNFEGSTRANAGSKETTKHNEFSYRVGALYELENGVSPFISYATSFEPTAGLDVNKNPFKPETSEQIEVGAKYQSQDMSKTASVSLYKIVKSDAIIANLEDYADPKMQIGEVTSQGIELQGQWFVNESLDISASYTYTDMEVTKDSAYDLEGTTPIYVPDHTANLWANYFVYTGSLAGTRLSAGGRYVGEMQMDTTNKQGKVPSYTVYDLSVGYELGNASESLSGATANLIVNNLFDEEYYTCYDKVNCWFGAERSIEVNVKYDF